MRFASIVCLLYLSVVSLANIIAPTALSSASLYLNITTQNYAVTADATHIYLFINNNLNTYFYVANFSEETGEIGIITETAVYSYEMILSATALPTGGLNLLNIFGV
jgi:hypothetical protein